MSVKTEKLMRDYLNASSMTTLCRGHCEVLRKNLDSSLTSVILQCQELSLGFVIPDDCRKLFLESMLDVMFKITSVQNHKTLVLLDKIKKQLKTEKKEFDIL